MLHKASLSPQSGLLYGLTAYGLWGLMPLYFNAVSEAPASELLAHRILWSAVLLAIVLTVVRRWIDFVRVCGDGRTLRMLLLSTLFIASNWFFYIYGVVTHQVLEASMGYFLTPLVNVLFGVLLLGERLRRWQWVAIGFAALGIVVLVADKGQLPWIALTLAGSFGLYGLIRKQTPVDGITGLAIETFLLTPISLGFLIYLGTVGELTFAHRGWQFDALIICSGIATTIPLVCFAQAVRRLQLVTIGLMQYISPTLAFLIAVLFLDEKFTFAWRICFALIWVGIIIFAVDSLSRHPAKPTTDEG